MGIAFLLLGLVPLMFLPIIGETTEGDEELVQPDENPDDGNDILNERPADDDIGFDDPSVASDDTPFYDDLLAPVDVDDQPDDGNQIVDAESVLQPTDEDDRASGSDGDEGAALLPINEIETVQENIFIDAASDTGLAYAEIESFDAGLDILHVSISPEMASGDIEIEVTLSDDGQDALVFVEQELIAILRGAPDAGPDDVVVTIENLAA